MCELTVSLLSSSASCSLHLYVKKVSYWSVPSKDTTDDIAHDRVCIACRLSSAVTAPHPNVLGREGRPPVRLRLLEAHMSQAAAYIMHSSIMPQYCHAFI